MNGKQAPQFTIRPDAAKPGVTGDQVDKSRAAQIARFKRKPGKRSSTKLGKVSA